MQQTFKGFIYMVAGKLATFKDKVERWFTYDSLVITQEQMVTINSICAKTRDVQYLSFIQDPKNKVIGVCIQGFTSDGNTYVTDNIPIDLNGNILSKGSHNEIAN